MTVPCVSSIDFYFAIYFNTSLFLTIRDDAIGIVGIVVVQFSRRIDIAHVIGVSRVRGTTLNNCHPKFLIYLFWRYLSLSDFFQFRNRFCTSSIMPVQWSILVLSIPNVLYAISIIDSNA